MDLTVCAGLVAFQLMHGSDSQVAYLACSSEAAEEWCRLLGNELLSDQEVLPASPGTRKKRMTDFEVLDMAREPVNLKKYGGQVSLCACTTPSLHHT